MKKESTLFGWLDLGLPVLFGALVGNNPAEVRALSASLKGLVRYGANAASMFAKMDFMVYSREVHKPIVLAWIALAVIALIDIFVTTGRCGPVATPWAAYGCAILVVVFQLPAYLTIRTHAPIRPSRLHLADGRDGIEVSWDALTDAEKDDETRLVGFNPRSDAATMADTNLTPPQRLEEVARRNHALNLLQGRSAFAPLVAEQPLADRLVEMGAPQAEEASLTSHWTTGFFGGVLSWIAFLASAVFLNMDAPIGPGVNPLYPRVIIIIAFAAVVLVVITHRLLWSLPLSAASYVGGGLAKPANGLYQLFMQGLPGVDDSNVVEKFGAIDGSGLLKLQAFDDKYVLKISASMLLVTAIGALSPSFFAFFSAVLVSAYAATMYRYQESEGIDTTQIRKDRAALLVKLLNPLMVLVLAYIFLMCSAPTLASDMLHALLVGLNGLFHLGRGLSTMATVVAFLVILAVTITVNDKRGEKSLSVWAKRFNLGVTVLLVFTLIGMTGVLPEIDADYVRRSTTLACPGTPERPSPFVRVFVPEPPSPTVQPAATPASDAPSGRRHRSRRARHVTPDAVYAGSAPRGPLPACEGRYSPGVQPSMRALGRCR